MHEPSAAGTRRGDPERGGSPSSVGGGPGNSRLQEMHSEHILPLNSPKNFGTLKGIFFVKYTTMLYQWQLVKKQGYTKQFSRQLS
jgi:hypothetical protein